MKARLGALLTVAAIAGAAGGAGASSHTQAIIYSPFGPGYHVSQSVHGYCFTGSNYVAHKGAYRCFHGNEILDPCFSSSKAKGYLLCAIPGPWANGVVKLTLTKRLPQGNSGKPSTKGTPWAIQTSTGWNCRLAGMGPRVGGKQGDYLCKQGWLFGTPSRTSQPWTIYAGTGNHPNKLKKVAVNVAWF